MSNKLSKLRRFTCDAEESILMADLLNQSPTMKSVMIESYLKSGHNTFVVMYDENSSSTEDTEIMTMITMLDLKS